MKLKITIGLFLAAFLLSAQTARMNRDIEVAEKILESLIEEVHQNGDDKEVILGLGNHRSQVEGTYIDGFGAMFTIVTGAHLRGRVVWKNKDKNKKRGKDDVVVITPGVTKLERLQTDETALKQNFKTIVETFVTEYAYLLRQLKANESIMIKYGMSPSHQTFFSEPYPEIWTHRKDKKRNYSATIKKEIIDDFQDGSLNKTTFIEKINYVFEEDAAQKEKYKDLEMLGTILGKLYQRGQAEKLYLTGTSNYEKLEGLGAIYRLKVRSKGKGLSYFGLGQSSHFVWSDDNVLVLQSGQGENETVKATKETEERAKQNLDKKYQSFIADFKSTIIDYGSIVKNLGAKESLIFKLDFPNCENCKQMPQRLEITAKKSILDGYRKDQLTLEKAIEQLIVK